MYNQNRKFLDATINRNDHSIKKKTSPDPYNDIPRIILRNPDDVIPLAVTSRNSPTILSL